MIFKIKEVFRDHAICSKGIKCFETNLNGIKKYNSETFKKFDKIISKKNVLIFEITQINLNFILFLLKKICDLLRMWIYIYLRLVFFYLRMYSFIK